MAYSFFPPWMNRGTKDKEKKNGRGPVRWYQQWLQSAGFATSELIADGEYDNQASLSTMNLQRHLGFTGDDVDGNLGQGTRDKAKVQLGVDFNAIPSTGEPEEVCLYVGPDSDEPVLWPPPANATVFVIPRDAD